MIEEKKTFFTQIQLITQYVADLLIEYKIHFSCPHIQDEETRLIVVTHEKNLKIKIIQIQNIIVFYIMELEKNSEEELLIDSFWINWKKHIKKKLQNTYILADIKHFPLKKTLFSRIFKHLQPKSNKFFRIVYNNLILFNQFLSPKEFKNLSICSSLMNRSLNQQSEYKMLYEERWGKTGFDLQEKNWINAYKKKIQSKR